MHTPISFGDELFLLQVMKVIDPGDKEWEIISSDDIIILWLQQEGRRRGTMVASSCEGARFEVLRNGGDCWHDPLVHGEVVVGRPRREMKRSFCFCLGGGGREACFVERGSGRRSGGFH